MTLQQLHAARLALAFSTVALGSLSAWEMATHRWPTHGAFLAALCAFAGVAMAEGPRFQRRARRQASSSRARV